MLLKPSILRTPISNHALGNGINACWSYNERRCSGDTSFGCYDGYTCHIHNGNNCIDANLEAWEWGGGTVVVGVVVGVAVT